MTAAVLDGKVVARATLQALRPRIEALPRPPGIAVVRVGEDPASKVYVGRKTARAAKLGFRHEEIHLNADVGQAELESVVDALNADDGIDGILVQLPLPASQEHVFAVLQRLPAWLRPRLQKGDGHLTIPTRYNLPKNSLIGLMPSKHRLNSKVVILQIPAK